MVGGGELPLEEGFALVLGESAREEVSETVLECQFVHSNYIAVM